MSTTSAALLPLCGPGRVRVDRDAAAVVVDPAAAVGQQRDDDAGAEAGHRLVDRVVDDLPDEVVETGEAGRADVHARAACGRGRGPRGPGCPWRRSRRSACSVVSRHVDANLSTGGYDWRSDGRRSSCTRTASDRDRAPSLPTGCAEEPVRRRSRADDPRRRGSGADRPAQPSRRARCAPSVPRCGRRSSSVGLEVPQLGRPARFVDLDHRAARRASPGGRGRDRPADGLLPAAEHAAHGQRVGRRQRADDRLERRRSTAPAGLARACRVVAPHRLGPSGQPSPVTSVPAAMRSTRCGRAAAGSAPAVVRIT